MYILGISAFFHDSAAVLIRDGEIIAAVQEERFSRIKNDQTFPLQSIRYCLSYAGITVSDLEMVVFYEKPFIKFERILQTIYETAPLSLLTFLKAMPGWIKEKLLIKKIIRDRLAELGELDRKKLNIQFSSHHLSHAASSYFASGFSEAAILTIDGVGEWATCTISVGSENSITIRKQLNFPHSVGLFFSAITLFCGFRVNSDEYKLMGLAAYGNETDPEYDKFRRILEDKLIRQYNDGSVQLNQQYFSFRYGSRMFDEQKWQKLFDLPVRKRNEPLDQSYCNLALAAQHVLENIVLAMAREAKQLTGKSRLCLAGGVALNCVANGKLAASGLFEDVFIQPASGDAGGALGAALAAYHIGLDKPLRITGSSADQMKSSLLGPSYSDQQVMAAANRFSFAWEQLADEELFKKVATLLSEGFVIGWHQGRMEFGPRALGNRSILADPRHPEMQRILNLKVKFREGFRPFAPIILQEEAARYFQATHPSPYMLLAFPLIEKYREPYPKGATVWSMEEKLQFKRSFVPAVTHIDYTARLQTVTDISNPKLYRLLMHFFAQTGCPMLINTSFNRNDEPIVNSPQEALDCLQQTDIDYLVINNFLFKKRES